MTEFDDDAPMALDRRVRLVALAQLHAQWSAAAEPGAEAFTPRPGKSDYNLHDLDIDANPAAEDAFADAAASIFSTAGQPT